MFGINEYGVACICGQGQLLRSLPRIGERSLAPPFAKQLPTFPLCLERSCLLLGKGGRAWFPW